MRLIKKLIPQKFKNFYHLAESMLANFLFGFPSRSIRVIGVTGTNGKTTTCQMIARILEEAGYKVAMITTINFKLGKKEWVNKTKYTTLSSFFIQKFILDAIKARCDFVILETSSHALDQYRVWGVNYQTAVITNVTREHLDYHKSMEKYRQAKLKLFKKAEKVVINLDMEKPEEFLQFDNKYKIGYTMQNAKINLACQQAGMQNDNAKLKIILAEDIELGINYSKFKIPACRQAWHNSKFMINMPGLFNIENALAAICVGLSEDLSLEICAKALAKIKGVPGRMEYVPNARGLNIIIDYAVTPDSLEKLYTLIQQINVKKTKIIAVFGACGERDRGKRPMMGEIVSRYVDYIILTNEDPYYEDPEQIIKELELGIRNKELSKNYWKILDRRQAIQKALQIAKPGDFVVVTGKGAEETMAVGERRIPWNDKKIILEELEKISNV